MLISIPVKEIFSLDSGSAGYHNTCMRELLPSEIRKVRTDLSLPQRKFAQVFGIHWVTVIKWEQGKLNPNAHQEAMLRQIAFGLKSEKVPFDVPEKFKEEGPISVLSRLLYWAFRKTNAQKPSRGAL